MALPGSVWWSRARGPAGRRGPRCPPLTQPCALPGTFSITPGRSRRRATPRRRAERTSAGRAAALGHVVEEPLRHAAGGPDGAEPRPLLRLAQGGEHRPVEVAGAFALEDGLDVEPLRRLRDPGGEELRDDLSHAIRGVAA